MDPRSGAAPCRGWQEGKTILAIQVVNTGMAMCSFGVAPTPLTFLPLHKLISSNMPAGNIMDHAPFLNIKPFGMCTSMANPKVAAATAKSLGVLTPQPCTPITPAPWIPGSPTVMLNNMPTLSNSCKCMCVFAGIINIIVPGQFTHMVA